MDTFSTTIFDSLSDELKGRVALSDGVLHVSAELKGKMELDALVARLRHRGRIAIEWHTPKKFDALFAGLLSGGIVLEDKNGVSRSDNVKRYVIELFRKAHELKASDIHITYNGQYTLIDLRRLGTLQYYSQLGGEEGKQLIQGIFQSDMSQAEASFSPFERQDGRIVDPMVLPNGVFSVRLHTEPIQSSMAANGKGVFLAIRMLYDATSAHGTLTERAASLGFTKEQGEMLLELTERSGLVVISGPTGHGKTTLLKHVFETMAEYQPGKNYVSFEDPPEYSLNGVKQVPITTKTINNDEERARAYNDALAGGMRMDPDTLMIGEIRYIEAAKAAISAALTGHAVWATVHASNALAIIPRLTEMGVTLKSLCNQNVLSGMIYQRLLSRLCSNCKKRLVDNIDDALPKSVMNRLLRVMDEGIESVCVRGDGCEQCGGMGLIGQTVAAEVIMADQTLLKLLRDDDLVSAHAYWVNELHGMTHVAHALRLIRDGLVDPLDAESRLGVPLDFDKAVTR